MFRTAIRRGATTSLRPSPTLRTAIPRKYATVHSDQHLAGYNLPKPPTPASVSRPPPKNISSTIHKNAAQDARDTVRQRWLAGTALVLAMGVAFTIIAETPTQQAETPSGSPSVLPGVPVVLDPSAETKGGVELVPSGTSSVPPFPRTFTPPSGGEHVLVGLGIRTVSFLSIQVYVVGLYVHADDLATIQSALVKRVAGSDATALVDAAGEAGELKRILMDGGEEGEKCWGELLDGVKFRSCFRVVPTRNTDFGHLRDGWVRGIQARSTVGGGEYDDEEFAKAMAEFKSVFKGGSVPKQKTLLLIRDREGGLGVWYDKTGRNDGGFGGKGEGEEARLLGKVKDRRVAKALWLCYLAGKKVASEGARESIVDGVLGMATRPTGTLRAAPHV